MDEQTFKQIKLLTEAQGTSGAEDDIRSIMTTQMTSLVDEVIQDGLGGVFGIKENEDNDAPRVMVAAHMDEVGFMVVGINDNGLLRVNPIGGWNPHVVSSQRFILKTKEARYPVISSSISPHLLRGKESNLSLDVSDVLFDAGFESKEEAEVYGVRPGDSIVPDVETILTANKKNIMGKAWDNRYGCWLVLEMLEHFKYTELPNTLIAGANVQEEVGLRGARPSVHKLNPDLFFAVDCSAADDIYSTTDTYGHLGEGFLLRILDPGMVTLPRMREFLYDIASTNNIEFQYFVSKGGTDAGAVHMMNDGIPSAVIGVCARYIHTHQSLYNISDFEAAREMLFATIAALDKSTVNTIIYGK